MEDSRNIIKAIDALTLKAGGEVVDSKNITEAIDNLKAVYDQEAIGIDSTLTQEGLAADAKAVGDAISAFSGKFLIGHIPSNNTAGYINSRASIIFVFRNVMEGNPAVSMIDQWGGITYLSTNDSINITVSSKKVTVSNNGSVSVNYVILNI